MEFVDEDVSGDSDDEVVEFEEKSGKEEFGMGGFEFVDYEEFSGLKSWVFLVEFELGFELISDLRI